MLHVGLDVSRTGVDVHAVDEAGSPVLVTTASPDAGGLASLVHGVGELGQPVNAASESMTGARFVHDQLEFLGWDVQIADAVGRQRGAKVARVEVARVEVARKLSDAIWHMLTTNKPFAPAGAATALAA